jgi:hypothetical protein
VLCPVLVEILGHRAAPFRPITSFESTDEFANQAHFVPGWNFGEAQVGLAATAPFESDHDHNAMLQVLDAIIQMDGKIPPEIAAKLYPEFPVPALISGPPINLAHADRVA